MKSLSDRMKRYEAATRLQLVPRMPTIIRVDGKAFHTLTKRMQRPFDPEFYQCMYSTAVFLCSNAQGCKFGYVQSDEISILLVDYERLESMPWLDAVLQKMCSISASLATSQFNYELAQRFPDIGRVGHFDARVFQLPRSEVVNYFIWRQRDATRNSILTAGQSIIGHKKIRGLKTDQIKDLLAAKGKAWNKEYSVAQQRGAGILKRNFTINAGTDQEALRTEWCVDYEMPILSGDRNYVGQYVGSEEP